MADNCRPVDAAPGIQPISFNPRDKHNRGVWLSPAEKAAFQGICDIGPDQLIDCYWMNVWSEDQTLNAYDFCCACSQCPHFLGRWKVYNPYRRAEDIFNAETVLHVLDEYISEGRSGWFVYFITDGEYIKIGKAKNPDERVAALQTGNGRQLELLWKIPCKSEAAALNLESRLHSWYRDYQTVGEWFNIKTKLHTSSFDFYFGG